MSYREALEAAGAIIFAFEEFGSYQGDWFAKVEYQGKRGWVTGYFGSCQICDAFEGEFGFTDEKQPDYTKRLTEFGEKYLEKIMSDREAKEEASKNSTWDTSVDEIVAFIERNGEGK